MMRFLVLVGYLELSMYLQVSGKLNQYINIQYIYLTYLSMILAFILAIVQLIIWMKQLEVSSHFQSKFTKLASVLILAFPLAIGWLVPTVSLDSTTVSAKGYHFPLAEGSSQTGESDDGTRVQYLKPDTSLYFTSASYQKTMAKTLDDYRHQKKLTITPENYMEAMEIIYLYPQEFIGKTITYTGFVYNDPNLDNHQFLFRFGVIHCIADSGVYGLLTRQDKTDYPDNTWLKVTGTLAMEYNPLLQQQLPVLDITDSQTVNTPNNPYVYRTF
ncbi:TIGR03943 family putative permease subunit [Streptococcus fryi]